MFDVTGQYKVASLLIQFALTEEKKSPDEIKSSWDCHKAAFEVLNEILQDEEKSDLRENYLEEQNLNESERDLVLSVLGLAE